MLRRMRSHLAACAVALALLLALASVSAYAQESPSLVLHSIDTQDYPTVRVGVTLPAGIAASGETPEFAVSENGVAIDEVQVEPVGAQREPLDVVLLVDASGSMSGRPIEDARIAAKRFISTMAEGDRIALLTFGERVDTLSGFSADKAALAAAVDVIAVRGETALYDGLLRAVELAEGSAVGDAYIVVLSDGGDTVSVATLDIAVKSATAARIPVYAVTLESPEYDPAPLRAIAERSGGKALAATDTASLGALFESIALELSNRYLITYTSTDPATAELEIGVVASGSLGSAQASSTISSPALGLVGLEEPLAGIEIPAAGTLAGSTALMVALGLVFLTVALLAFELLRIVLPEKNVLGQLHYYEQMHGSKSPEDVSTERAETDSGGVLRDAVDYVAGKGGFKAALREQLEHAGLPLRPTEYMYFHVIGVVTVGVIAQVLGGRLALTLVVILAAVFVPIVLLQMRVTKRCAAFEAQLPDILGLIAGSLRAGWGVQQSIDLVVQEAAEPAKSEFRRVQAEVRLGMALEESLSRMAERLDSGDFRWTVAAITIQREVGGNLAEVLDIVAGTVRERADLRREVSALTAEGRLSAVILTILPFVMFGAMLLANPSYMRRLTGAPLGLVILAFGLALLGVGIVWIRATIRIEV